MKNNRFRHGLYKLILAVLSPIVFIVLVEVLFRVADVGYSTRFFVEDRIAERAVYRDNTFFSYRFFDPVLARSPSPSVMDREKPEKVFRVVVLGESAAQGDPSPEFGVSRVLAPLLQAGLASGKVEVINAALTAISSPVILEIARDLPRMRPDLVILYIGNNEAIGPFGPGTVFMGFLDSDLALRLVMGLSRLRLTQFLRMTLALASDRRAPKHFDGVEMFMDHPIEHSDPRLETMRRRYRRNIQRLIARAQECGARVLLSSVAVNLEDCPPAVSFMDPTLAPRDRATWTQLYREGLEARNAHDWSRALTLFRQAVSLDRHHAEAVYLLAQSLDRQGRRAEAEEHYRRARDLDGFRYRADSALNDTLRACARQNPSVIWVDAEAAFQAFSDAGDADFFVDHVHFSFSGTYRLARLWAEALMNDWPRPGPFRAEVVFPDESALRDQLLFTPLTELSVFQHMIVRFRRPPFNRQLDAEARLAACRERAGELSQAVKETDIDALRARFAEVFRVYPGDPYWAWQWGQWLLVFQRYREVVSDLGDSIARYPHRMLQRAPVVQALAAMGRTGEAADMLAGWQKKQGFFVASELDPQVASLVANGCLPEALALAREVERITRRSDYRHRVRRIVDTLSDTHRDIEQAKAWIERGDDAEALPLLERANRSFRSPEPAYWMGVLQARQGRDPTPYLLQAFQTWGQARASYHAGLWRAKARAYAEAQSYFMAAASAAGDDFELIRSLAWIYLAYPDPEVRDPEKAGALAAALRRGLDRPDSRLAETLAAVQGIGGQWDRDTETEDREDRWSEEQTGKNPAGSPQQPPRHGPSRKRPGIWPVHQVPMNFF